MAGSVISGRVVGSRSECRETIGRGLAGAAVLRHLVGNLLAFAQRLQTGALDCADVDEHVLAAVIRLDEAIAFLRVEPLDRSSAHSGCPLIDERFRKPRHCGRGGWSMFGKSSSIRHRARTRSWRQVSG